MLALRYLFLCIFLATSLLQATNLVRLDELDPEERRTRLQSIYVPSFITDSLFQTTKDIVEVLTDAGIPYTAAFGTLLDLKRCSGDIKGIKKHDDDVDLGIDIRDSGRLWEQESIFDALGYKLLYQQDLSRFIVEAKQRVPVTLDNDKVIDYLNFVDIFVFMEQGDRYVLAEERARDEHKNPHLANGWFTRDEFINREFHNFGSIRLAAPINAIDYLHRKYGPSCLQEAYFRSNHIFPNHSEIYVWTLTEEEKKPALPTKELQNRYHKHLGKASKPFWTLDHSHDIRHGLQKLRQKGFTAYNDTNEPVTITLTGSVPPENRSQVIPAIVPPKGRIRFNPELTYVDMTHAFSESPYYKTYINLIKEQNRYDLRVAYQAQPFIPYGDPNFTFKFNWLEKRKVEPPKEVVAGKEIVTASPSIPKGKSSPSQGQLAAYGTSLSESKEAPISIQVRAEHEKEAAQKDPPPKKPVHASSKDSATPEEWNKWCDQYNGNVWFLEYRVLKETGFGREVCINIVKEILESTGIKHEEYMKILSKVFGKNGSDREVYDKFLKKIEKSPKYKEIVSNPLSLEIFERQANILRELLEKTVINREIYTKKLNEAYRKHSPARMFDYFKEHPVDTLPFKIPPITHTIWFTHPDKPIEFPEIYVESLKRTTEACPKSQGFEHILWVLDKSKMPKTVDAFKGSDVRIREMSELGPFHLKSFIEDAVYKQRKMGLSTDAVRAILQQVGGVYKDADYEFRQSIAPWLKYYDFVGSVEPMSSFVGNAFFMAAPHHPIINAYVDIIERNGFGDVPDYIKDVLQKDKAYATIAITGPGALTEAVATMIGRWGRHDVILPHPYFYPSVTNRYPELDVNKHHKLPVDAISLGVHYWHTTWDKEEYGSKG